MIDHAYGTLDRITDTERRPLRPIGSTAHEVAARTGALLDGLLGGPGVRMYRGVHLAGRELPPISYALSAGRQVVLVESVAWPPGSYATAPGGAVFCDDTYIGQSVRPLVGAVHRLRRLLSRGHRVSAVVVVHPCAAGRLTLPAASGGEVAWAHAGEAVRTISRRLLRRGPRPVASPASAALAAASMPRSINVR
jgi:hypothetical protein